MLHTLITHLQGYIETKIELAKLDVKEAVNAQIRQFAALLLMAFFGFLFILFAGIAMAEWVSEYLHSKTNGYMCVAVVYLAGAVGSYFIFQYKKQNKLL